MLESLHFIGLCLLFRRRAGRQPAISVMKNARFVDVHRLLPWGVWGFVINSVTGMMFFAGAAGQNIENPAFHLKVLCILPGGRQRLYLTLFDEGLGVGPGDNAPTSAKLVAAHRCFWGRRDLFRPQLPYYGKAF